MTEQDTSTDLTQMKVRDHGVTGLVTAFAATFYLTETTEAAARRRIAQFVETLRDELGSALLWGQHPRTLRWRTAGSVEAVTEWLPDLDPNQAFEFQFHGGDESADAADTEIAGFGNPVWQGGRAYVRVLTPLAQALSDPAGAIKRVSGWAEELQPAHGWAGPAVAEAHEVEFMQLFQPDVWKMVQQTPGLMTDDPVQNVDVLTDKVMGGAWLTFLGPDLAERVAAPEAPARKADYAGGSVLVAAPAPCLAASATADCYDGYRAVSRALDGVAITHHGGLHFSGADRMHADEMATWLSRFAP